MGLELENHFADYVPQMELIRVLELGSGTGLGGIHFAKLMQHMDRHFNLYMTDICEKSLKLIKQNVEQNKAQGVSLCQLAWGNHQSNSDACFKEPGFPE